MVKRIYKYLSWFEDRRITTRWALHLPQSRTACGHVVGPDGAPPPLHPTAASPSSAAHPAFRLLARYRPHSRLPGREIGWVLGTSFRTKCATLENWEATSLLSYLSSLPGEPPPHAKPSFPSTKDPHLTGRQCLLVAAQRKSQCCSQVLPGLSHGRRPARLPSSPS